MGRYFTQAQAYRLVLRAGGTPAEARFLAGVMKPESNGDSLARGPVTRYGFRAAGLWQIHPPQPGWQIPINNARMALSKLRSQGKEAWEAFTRGLSEDYVPGRRDQLADRTADRRTGPQAATAAQRSAFAKALTDPRVSRDPMKLLGAIKAVQKRPDRPVGPVEPTMAGAEPGAAGITYKDQRLDRKSVV